MAEQRGPATDIEFKNLYTKNTFADSNPGLSQEELQLEYQKRWKKHIEPYETKYGTNPSKWPKTKVGDKEVSLKSIAWRDFKDVEGELLSPELDQKGKVKANAERGGQAVFKTRFTSTGKLTTSAAVGMQVRSDRLQMLTEATPGTILDFEATAKQFYDPETWRQLEIHHFDSQASFAPFTDATRIKLGSTDPKIRAEGLEEYRAFSQTAWKDNIILGNKEEGFIALGKDSHKNVKGSAHVNVSKLGDTVTAQASGGPAFGTDTNAPDVIEEDLNKFPRRSKKAQGDDFVTSQEWIDRLPATGKGRTRWTALSEWHGLTNEANVEAANKAIIFGQWETRGKIDKPTKRVEPGESLRQKIGLERYTKIAKGNLKGISQTLLRVIKEKGPIRQALEVGGMAQNPLVNVGSDILGAVWDGVAVMADPSDQDAKIDLALSGGQAITGLLALGLTMVPVPGARPGAWALIKIADAAALAKAKQRLDKTTNALAALERQWNMQREGVAIIRGDITIDQGELRRQLGMKPTTVEEQRAYNVESNFRHLEGKKNWNGQNQGKVSGTSPSKVNVRGSRQKVTSPRVKI